MGTTETLDPLTAMAFPPDFLDELRSRVTLSEVVGRRVKLVKRGREHSGLCPFHNEKTPSFTVSDEKGFYHCFGCGAHGSAMDFVMNNEGLSFPEAVERLAAQAGMAVPQESPQERARAEKRAGLIDVLEAATAWFEEQLAGRAGQEARDYLAGRGLAPQTVAAFRLGYAPRERGALAKALRARGITVEQLLEAGLVKRSEEHGGPDPGEGLRDYFFHRVIFPISDRRGRIIAFGGRALGESKAKYLNSPETGLFHKGRELYNLSRARKAAHDSGELLVTEGYMDVIALSEGGFPAAVAPLGTAITEEQIAALWRLAPEPTLCFDGDAAGQRAAWRAAERALPLLRAGQSLRFALLPAGEDPDSLLRGKGAAALRQVLEAALPLAEVVWRRASAGRPADTPERRAAIRATLRDQIKTIRDPELREDYRQEMDRRYEEVFGFAGGRQPRTAAGAVGRGRRDWRAGRWPPKDRAGGGWGPPAAPAKRRGPADLLNPQRTEQLLLATLINHNKLLTEFVEDLVGIDLVSDDLSTLRRALIDCFARHPELDSEGVKCHLSNQGYSGVLERLLAPEVYVHGRFARPDTSTELARQSVMHILGVLRERRAAPQLAEETLALATEMTTDQLKRVQARQKLRSEEDGRRVDLDRFDSMAQAAADETES